MTAKEFRNKFSEICDSLGEIEARVRRENKPDIKLLETPLPVAEQGREFLLEDEKRPRIAAQRRIAERAERLKATYRRDLVQLTNEVQKARFDIQQQLWICQRPIKYMGRMDATQKYREIAAQFIPRAKEPKDVAPLILDNLTTPDLCSELIDQARARWTGKTCRDFEKAVETFEKAAGIEPLREELEAFDALLLEVQRLTEEKAVSPLD
jgi:hypothetical protein